jgi:hypothetical protein
MVEAERDGDTPSSRVLEELRLIMNDATTEMPTYDVRVDGALAS